MVVKTRRRKEQEAQEAAAEASEPNQSPDQKLPVRAKDDESPQVSKVAKSSLTVFDDDDNAAPFQIKETVVAKPKVIEEEPEEGSSDDEAPEAVSTAKIASDVKKTAQAAQKATQEQNALQKRKRQERDTLLKQQAEQRKQAEKDAAADGDEEDSEPAAVQKPSWQKNLDRIQMPNLLPMEYLTDESSEDEDSDLDMNDGAVAEQGGSKRRKVANVERDLARLDRGPRDERVGSTVYRVAKKMDQKLAPKARKQSQNKKELLMRRNRTPVQPRKGFFTKA